MFLCGLKEDTVMGWDPCRLWGRNLSGGGHDPDGDAQNTAAGRWKIGWVTSLLRLLLLTPLSEEPLVLSSLRVRDTYASMFIVCIYSGAEIRVRLGFRLLAVAGVFSPHCGASLSHSHNNGTAKDTGTPGPLQGHRSHSAQVRARPLWLFRHMRWAVKRMDG